MARVQKNEFRLSRSSTAIMYCSANAATTANGLRQAVTWKPARIIMKAHCANSTRKAAFNWSRMRSMQPARCAMSSSQTAKNCKSKDSSLMSTKDHQPLCPMILMRKFTDGIGLILPKDYQKKFEKIYMYH